MLLTTIFISVAEMYNIKAREASGTRLWPCHLLVSEPRSEPDLSASQLSHGWLGSDSDALLRCSPKPCSKSPRLATIFPAAQLAGCPTERTFLSAGDESFMGNTALP